MLFGLKYNESMGHFFEDVHPKEYLLAVASS